MLEIEDLKLEKEIIEVKEIRQMPHFYTKNKNVKIVEMSPKELLACDK